jgi:hypothetical protein
MGSVWEVASLRDVSQRQQLLGRYGQASQNGLEAVVVGRTVRGRNHDTREDAQTAPREIISGRGQYAAVYWPGAAVTQPAQKATLQRLGGEPNITSSNYAALGRQGRHSTTQSVGELLIDLIGV